MKLKDILLSAFACTSFLLGTSSCDDKGFLEENSHTFTSSTAFNTPQELEMGIGYLHSRIQYLMMGQWGQHNYMMTGLGLDTYFNNGSTFITSNWTTFTPNEPGYSRHWYEQLCRLNESANVIIKACDERDIAWSNETQKNQIKAEAVFFRGWAHRCLAGMYGDTPLMLEATTSAKVDYVRASRNEVWKQCIIDFQWASDNLPLTTSSPGRIVKAAADHMLAEVAIAAGNYDVAIAAATRVIDGTDGDYHLMTKRFGTRASELVDRYGNPHSSYWDLFRMGNQDYQNGNKESIWVCQFDYELNVNKLGGGGVVGWASAPAKTYVENSFISNTYYQNNLRTLSNGKTIQLWGDGAVAFADGTKSNVPTDSTGYGGGGTCRPTNYFLYTVWNNCGDDVRGSEEMIQRNTYQSGGKLWPQAIKEAKERYANAVSTGDPDAEKYKINASDTMTIYPRIWKFTTDKHKDGDYRKYDADWYMIRMSETYLLRAEAYMDKGDKANAAKDINVVRERAKAPLCSVSDVTLDYILDERARELYGEEHRTITLSRLSTKENPVLVERVRKYGWDWPSAPALNAPNIQNHQWIYPIPYQVIAANTGAEFTQNEGY